MASIDLKDWQYNLYGICLEQTKSCVQPIEIDIYGSNLSIKSVTNFYDDGNDLVRNLSLVFF